MTIACPFCYTDISELYARFVQTCGEEDHGRCPTCDIELYFDLSDEQCLPPGWGIAVVIPDATPQVLLLARWDPTEGLSTSHVARIVGVEPLTVRLLCRSGKFPGAARNLHRTGPRGYGRQWKIPRQDVRAYLMTKGHRRQPPIVSTTSVA